MTKFALAAFFLLFGVMHLLETKIPGWVLGIAAILCFIALILDAYWKPKTP